MKSDERKCENCNSFKRLVFCGYEQAFCKAFGSLDVDQSERHPDEAGAACPKFEPKQTERPRSAVDHEIDRIFRSVKGRW